MTAGSGVTPVRRALVSVSDKTGVAELARALYRHGTEILSTGGTARRIAEAGVPVVEVSEHTGFPEIMDGRVKTLHPVIHGGLLGRRGEDDAVMAERGITPIDLLVVNLYPFERTVAGEGCTLSEAIENIDIGGPAMIRAAAKNHASVGVVTDSADYQTVIAEIDREGGLTAATRFRLAAAAFAHTARYDAAISEYLASPGAEGDDGAFPERIGPEFIKAMDLRYGENPHQQAAFYHDRQPAPGTLATFRQIQGKTLSFNNIADADAAWECARQFELPVCVIVKHANPCGVAVAETPAAAYARAFETDPTSAFGGIVAFNRALDGVTAQAVLAGQFVELLIAPVVTADARAVLAGKPSVRVLEIPAGQGHNRHDLKRIGGGLLVQSTDTGMVGAAELRTVSRREPDQRELSDLLFVWRVAKYVKSNAIVYGAAGRTLGIGAGQMSRVDSARIGARKAAAAGCTLEGAVLASDAFFPFRDGIDQAAQVGVRAVIQPGGSIRDPEVIAAADEHDIAMVFTGMRHFRH